MILKQIPQDFIVDELYNLELLKKKDEGKEDFFYFKLTKTNYSQMKSLAILADAFSVSKTRIHFSGTKDKNAVTTQLISIYALDDEQFKINMDFVNEKIKDIELEYLGKFKGRLNLGDNSGNKFTITVRGLEKEEIDHTQKNLEHIKEFGAINYFDDQRFGFANNSHLIGLRVLRNQIEEAVHMILTSKPKDPSIELIEFVDAIEENWKKIKNADEQAIEKCIDLVPDFFQDAKAVLEHLKKAKNDFPGAFRTLHKKLRTLYVNAYQSYIFNKVARGEPDLDIIPLITDKTVIPQSIKEQVEEILANDEINQKAFELKHMPELKPQAEAIRKLHVYPKNIELTDPENDDLNEGKQKVTVSFELGSGEYATNVVKQLFL